MRVMEAVPDVFELLRRTLPAMLWIKKHGKRSRSEVGSEPESAEQYEKNAGISLRKAGVCVPAECVFRAKEIASHLEFARFS